MEDFQEINGKKFIGKMESGAIIVPISFSIELGLGMHLNIIVDDIPFDEESEKIVKDFNTNTAIFTEYTIKSKLNAERHLTIIGVHIISYNAPMFRQFGGVIKIKVDYKKAFYYRSVSDLYMEPKILTVVKGYKGKGVISLETQLGKLNISNYNNGDAGSDYAVMSINSGKEVNIADWREKVDELLFATINTISFAGNSKISEVISTFYFMDYLETTFTSINSVTAGQMPVIHPNNYQALLSSAIRSHFNRNERFKDMVFSTEWFNIWSGYGEVQLVSAMTALENIIDSNLSEVSSFTLPKNKFNRLSKNIRSVIKNYARDSNLDEEKIIGEMAGKISDINRVSLNNKIRAMAREFDVSMSGINDDMISRAISARNVVVHTGKYKPKDVSGYEFFEHVVVIREIVARFILASIEYSGEYISYIGGYHTEAFPHATNEIPNEPSI